MILTAADRCFLERALHRGALTPELAAEYLERIATVHRVCFLHKRRRSQEGRATT